jgi:hypothetical protein
VKNVDKGSFKTDADKGAIAFAAVKGKSLDLGKIVAALKATKLGSTSKSELGYLELTATGEVAVHEKGMVLKVARTTQEFALGDDPAAKTKAGERTAFQRLQEAVKKGDKVVSVTGRVHGLTGVFPTALKQVLKNPPPAGRDGFPDKEVILVMRPARLPAASVGRGALNTCSGTHSPSVRVC